jgi:predicted TIM-barrel fold metal-dependent hydrolase
MTVIDVDCHYDVALTMDNHPLREFVDKLPSPEELMADAMAGDLTRYTPVHSRPSDAHLSMYLPDTNRSSAEQATRPGQFEHRFPVTTPEDRLAWFNGVGIDHAFMNPGGYGFAVDWLGADRAKGIRACNDFMADGLVGHTDRMIPVSLIDWSDLDGAVREMTRMRGRGSRAFWLTAKPFNHMSPAHPDWDRVWSAATDLGMIGLIHVGNTPARFDGGWGNAGWEMPTSTGLGGYFRFANSLRHQAAEMLLSAMIYGGVFGRHPHLTVITEELQVAWMPYFVARCDGLSMAGPWPYELTPSEMVRKHVRATPLPGLGDQQVVEETLLQLPEMLVFSSDYPHGEGNADPIGIYEPALSNLDDSLRASFLGENIAGCFARMGDPLIRSSS